MRRKDPRLLVQPPPLLKPPLTTERAMWDVVYALIPPSLAGTWFFGLGAGLVLAASVGGALAGEWLFSPPEDRRQRLGDGSALLTGLLLGLSLPPALPLWMAFLGGLVGVGLGKVVWGGLGQNLFNPALVGRAFLASAFPTAMTTWSAPLGQGLFQVPASTLAPPFMSPSYDGLTSATPLGLMKFEQTPTPLLDLVIGQTSGCIGETSGLLLLLGGLYLGLRRDLDWRVPVAIGLAVLAGASPLFAIAPGHYPDPLFSLFSGGLLLGAIYMATDPVTSPLSPRGAWIFGVGIGALVVLIRNFGGFPEGVMYAILLMNAATPLIDRYTQPRVFGTGLDKK